MLFLDCESAGLRGDIFAAALINENGETLFDGFFRHPDLKTNSWLRENVEPNLTGTKYATQREFASAFAQVWLAQACRQVVAHMGSPVESNFFQQLAAERWNAPAIGRFQALIGEFDGPYPLLDTAPLLFAAGYDPTSEQDYAKSAGIILPADYKPHSALSDAQLTRLVWMSLTGQERSPHDTGRGRNTFAHKY